MNRCLIAASVLAPCLIAPASDSSARLRFKTAGFSIQPLAAPPGARTYQVLAMFLPPTGGFLPNVNVQIQPYSGTIGQYAALSKTQFTAAKFTLIKETKIGKTAVALEYSGTLQGRRLHWYARAVATGTHVYLVTATSTEAQWPQVSGRLKACVDSFQLESAEATTRPSASRPSGAER